MATINIFNQASEALVVGPIGVASPDPTNYLIKIVKSTASAGMGLIAINTDASGFGALVAQNNGNKAGGIYAYGSTYSDDYGASNEVVVFSNNAASGMNIACENGSLKLRVGATGQLQATLSTTGGQYRGYNSDTVPSAGYIGQIIYSVVTGGSPIALTTATPTNLTSIDLTAGVWDVTLSVAFGSAVAITTVTAIGINTTSATLPNVNTEGDQRCMSPIGPTAVANTSLVVPAFRVYIAASTTTTYYGVVSATFTGMSMNATGRLSAVRVA